MLCFYSVHTEILHHKDSMKGLFWSSGFFCLLTAATINFALSQSDKVILCSHSGPLTQRSGFIVHIKDNQGPARPCEVQLPAPSSSFIFIDGVKETSNDNPCTYGTLTIKDSSFCVDKNSAHVFPSMPALTVSSLSTTANFTISFNSTGNDIIVIFAVMYGM